MNTKKVLSLLDPKNQNLPALEVKKDYGKSDLVIFGVTEGSESQLKKEFPELKKLKFSGKKGELTQIMLEKQILQFVGLGKKDQLNNRKMRRFFGAQYLKIKSQKIENAALYCPLEFLEYGVIGTHVAALEPGIFKPKFEAKNTPQLKFFHSEFGKKKKEAELALKKGKSIAAGKNTMRILGVTPPNVLHPQSYAEIAMKLAKKWKVKAKRINGSKLKKYELINAVCAGSDYNAEILIFTVHPKKGKTKKATAIIGKGLCFDSGGNQSKGNYMKSMREDMGGSASVMGALCAVATGEREVKETTHFVIALAENMQDSSAMRPDDVYTAGDGQTVEIIHTDAEGRLALADAICYMKKNFPETQRFYTIATLTGSCVSALSDIYTGGLCNNEKLSSNVSEAGKKVGDYVHFGPWDMEYDDCNSPIADVANLGINKREGGWIKAGLFLYRFIPKGKNNEKPAEFCHFDIAGSIDMDEGGKSWRKKGLNSGACVTLLSELVSE